MTTLEDIAMSSGARMCVENHYESLAVLLWVT